MAFDESKDKTIEEQTISMGNTKITVAIKQYDKGAKKIQLSRVNVRNGEEQFAKLGRLTKEEAEKVISAMQELVTKIE